MYAPPKLCFLFLQGPASSFFGQLGCSLRERGHTVYRVNFNFGDRLFWPLPGAIDYRGTTNEWPAFLSELLRKFQVTNIILFGDCRPLHRIAIAVAAHHSVTVNVFEEGYLRPNWITLEVSGVNGNSTLPRDPAWYIEAAKGAPPVEEEELLGRSFYVRARNYVIYYLASMTGHWYYPRYRRHRPLHPVVEFVGWTWRIARLPIAQRRSHATLRRILVDPKLFFLFPLQLDSDCQIRVHSLFPGLEAAMEKIISSFARHAPPDTHLLVKQHPLDNGVRNWRSVTRKMASAFGAGERVTFLEEADIAHLVPQSRGVVTINSTTGTLALARGVPTIVLGRAVYDLPGLTFQGEIDAFWRQASPPDAKLFDAFRRVTVARCLIRGGFFSKESLATLLAQAVAKLETSAHRLASDGQQNLKGRYRVDHAGNVREILA